jgi:hypothetical protein
MLFVVGHLSVKMLVYFDEQEEMVKRVITTGLNRGSKKEDLQ